MCDLLSARAGPELVPNKRYLLASVWVVAPQSGVFVVGGGSGGFGFLIFCLTGFVFSLKKENCRTASLRNLQWTVVGLLCRAFHCGHGDKLVLSDRAC